MIRVVHPGSGCWLSTHPRSRIQGSKRHRIPQHWISLWHVLENSALVMTAWSMTKCLHGYTVHNCFLLTGISKESFLDFYFSSNLFKPVLFRLPPLRVYCVGGCWDWTLVLLRPWHWRPYALNIRLDLIYDSTGFHPHTDRSHSQLGSISSKTRLDLIHNSARSHPQTWLDLVHNSARSHLIMISGPFCFLGTWCGRNSSRIWLSLGAVRLCWCLR